MAVSGPPSPSLERIIPTGPHSMEIRYQYLFTHPPPPSSAAETGAAETGAEAGAGALGRAEQHAIDTSAEVGGGGGRRGDGARQFSAAWYIHVFMHHPVPVFVCVSR